MMLHQRLPLEAGDLPHDALFISFRFLGARAAASAPSSATAPGTVDTASVKRLLARTGKPHCDMKVGTLTLPTTATRRLRCDSAAARLCAYLSLICRK